MKYIFIYAGNYTQALEYANRLGLPRHLWRYIDSIDRLLGTKLVTIWCYGTYYEREDYCRFQSIIHMIQANLKYV